MKPPQPEDIIRIEMIDKPETRERGDGLYEWRHLDRRYYCDIIDTEKDLKTLSDDYHSLHKFNSENILDRIYNFTKVYINVKTGEVST